MVLWTVSVLAPIVVFLFVAFLDRRNAAHAIEACVPDEALGAKATPQEMECCEERPAGLMRKGESAAHPGVRFTVTYREWKPGTYGADGIYRSGSCTETSEDEAFNAAVSKHFGDSLKFAYYGIIAGSKHSNEDGTRRTEIIGECSPGEVLDLIPEPDNPFDPKAMSVQRFDGARLGYVPGRSAAEMEVGRRRRGEVWKGVLRHHNHHPESGHVVGATILYVCLSPAQDSERQVCVQ